MNRCDICGGALQPGARILWRVLKNTEDETGFSATHLVCPRLVYGLVIGLAAAVAGVAGVIVFT